MIVLLVLLAVLIPAFSAQMLGLGETYVVTRSSESLPRHEIRAGQMVRDWEVFAAEAKAWAATATPPATLVSANNYWQAQLINDGRKVLIVWGDVPGMAAGSLARRTPLSDGVGVTTIAGCPPARLCLRLVEPVGGLELLDIAPRGVVPADVAARVLVIG